MGGYGSGRTIPGSQKIKTDDCLILDIGQLVQSGLIKPNKHCTAKLEWPTGHSIGCKIDTRVMSSPFLTLHYDANTPVGKTIQEADDILFETTRPHFGGIHSINN